MTFVPNRWYTEPSYRPITPPPIIAKSFGTLGTERAPVELRIIFSSKGRPGKLVGSLPVAMIIFLAEICSFCPSALFTWLNYDRITQ